MLAKANLNYKEISTVMSEIKKYVHSQSLIYSTEQLEDAFKMLPII